MKNGEHHRQVFRNGKARIPSAANALLEKMTAGHAESSARSASLP